MTASPSKSDGELLVELAVLTLRVLDLQRLYFKSRNRETLIESKRLESELRVKANEVLARAQQPRLL